MVTENRAEAPPASVLCQESPSICTRIGQAGREEMGEGQAGSVAQDDGGQRRRGHVFAKTR